MSGFEIAAGAAGLWTLCDRLVSKVVPFLAGRLGSCPRSREHGIHLVSMWLTLTDTVHTDEHVRSLHRQVRSVQDVLKMLETTFRDDRRRSDTASIGDEHVSAFQRHITEYQTALRNLTRELPEIQHSKRPLPPILITQIQQLVRSGTISKMCEDVASMKATLQLWLEVLVL